MIALVVLSLETPRKFLSHFSLGFTGRFDPDSSGAQRFMEEQRKFNPKPTRKQFEAGGNIPRFTRLEVENCKWIVSLYWGETCFYFFEHTHTLR